MPRSSSPLSALVVTAAACGTTLAGVPAAQAAERTGEVTVTIPTRIVIAPPPS